MKRYILFVLVLLTALPSIGREMRRTRPEYQLKRHEFALGGAFYPGRYAFGYDFDFIPMRFTYLTPSGISDIYKNSTTYNKERVTNSWTASYTYNFTRLFALQIGLSYEGGWNECYQVKDDTMISSISSQYLTPMLTGRFTWLNRKYVRMYSSIGVGMAVSLSSTHYVTDDNTVHERPDTYISMQVTPVGISVGKKLFGFVEAGVGTIYFGGCFGIGYRF
ncbi:MAG: outer membrane beta-barrel protein [Bacteroidales bacterium]|nr:outer membrane beta-barrel protein [Bacteroides sp.]MCM1502345.1 outer membrane beta-barrel protein [Bacteroidales bacterium]